MDEQQLRAFEAGFPFEETVDQLSAEMPLIFLRGAHDVTHQLLESSFLTRLDAPGHQYGDGCRMVGSVHVCSTALSYSTKRIDTEPRSWKRTRMLSPA